MSQTAVPTTIRSTLRPTAVGPVVVTAPRGDHGGTTTESDGTVTEADGALPDGVTVFDDQCPGVADPDPELLQALS